MTGFLMWSNRASVVCRLPGDYKAAHWLLREAEAADWGTFECSDMDLRVALGGPSGLVSSRRARAFLARAVDLGFVVVVTEGNRRLPRRITVPRPVVFSSPRAENLAEYDAEHTPGHKVKWRSRRSLRRIHGTGRSRGAACGAQVGEQNDQSLISDFSDNKIILDQTSTNTARDVVLVVKGRAAAEPSPADLEVVDAALKRLGGAAEDARLNLIAIAMAAVGCNEPCFKNDIRGVRPDGVRWKTDASRSVRAVLRLDPWPGSVGLTIEDRLDEALIWLDAVRPDWRATVDDEVQMLREQT